jgi:hypothetical protein
MTLAAKDILYLALAIAVLWLAVFLSLALYHIIGILRDAHHFTHDFQERIDRFEHTIHRLREKFEHSTSTMLLLGEGVKQLLNYILEKRGSASDKRRNKSAK